MAYRFTAQLACGFDDPDQDDCVMAGVAESDDEEGFSLLFMCDFDEPDAQEVSLGMDTQLFARLRRQIQPASGGHATNPVMTRPWPSASGGQENRRAA
ncbi:hypothetical protein ACFCYB_14995 [Streptomyces sp. NPDC056309]|uniref:hypothetical protein n=1 Tax=unclassified Streptomyces TaxID=2593676 RepID=UPI0035D6435F